MIEVKTVREMACRLCGAIERLREGEPDPKSCPRCFDGKSVAWSAKPDPKAWSA